MTDMNIIVKQTYKRDTERSRQSIIVHYSSRSYISARKLSIEDSKIVQKILDSQI